MALIILHFNPLHLIVSDSLTRAPQLSLTCAHAQTVN